MSSGPGKAAELGMTLEQTEEFAKALWKGLFEEPKENLVDRIRDLQATCRAQDQAAQKIQKDLLQGHKAIKALEEVNTPEIQDFLVGVEREAKHQRLRWGEENDGGKTDTDWFWLIGYLAGKAVSPTSEEKRLHHLITTAAALLNWHAARVGTYTKMRPGIGEDQ